MTSIYRTAYPRFHSNQKWKQKELEDAYTLTEAELGYIKRHIRGEHLKLSFAILLKIFQQLGYFPSLKKIPKDVIEHVKKQLPLASSSAAFYDEHESTLHRHRLLIYSYLKITRWNKAKDGQNPARQYACVHSH